MLLERLAVQDLCEDVRRVLLGPEVLNCHQSGAAHLPQLKQFTIDVARMLRRTEAMAKVKKDQWGYAYLLHSGKG